MRALSIELRKEKRTGVIPLMLAVGIMGAAYALINFIVRKDTLLNLPLAPMDVLLTQVYGMIMILNMFGVIVASCIIYNMEFKGSAVKKMYLLPMSVPAMYFCKFLILSIMLLITIGLQYLALAKIGITDLPKGTFELGTLVSFAGYSFTTSMPVLAFMIFVYVDTAWYWSGRLFKWNGVSNIRYKMAMCSSICGYAEARRCDERTARYGYCNNSIG